MASSMLVAWGRGFGAAKVKTLLAKAAADRSEGAEVAFHRSQRSEKAIRGRPGSYMSLIWLRKSRFAGWTSDGLVRQAAFKAFA